MVHCISIIIAIYFFNDKFYIGCHFDNMPSAHRYKKISSCGGNVERDETFLQGAVREAREEHGLIVDEKNLTLIHTKETSYDIYKYYIVNVTPNDYHENEITTPSEIFGESFATTSSWKTDYINEVFSHFPPNSVINTRVNTTFLIDYDVLQSLDYKQYILHPFQKFLRTSYFKNVLTHSRNLHKN